MSTLTKSIGLSDPDLSDKVTEVKTSFVLAQEAAAKAAKESAKEDKKSE